MRQDRLEQGRDALNDFGQIRRHRIRQRTPDECTPARLYRLDLSELRVQRNRSGLDGRSSPPKCALDRSGQGVPPEVEVPGEEPQVGEILHPTVAFAQADHGFEFLGDNALTTVSFQARRREVEDDRVLGLDRSIA
jgi:hypothetical protein